MIDKFNFYDVYGYFLPGLALIAVLWLPFGLVAHIWPSGDWGSAVVAIALAYFLGHFMLYASTNAIPSFDVKKSTTEKERFPSSTLLDSNSRLSSELRGKIAKAVSREFAIDVHLEDAAGKFDKIREEAFLLARQRLNLEKVEGYAEQFQGMYSLARGLFVALLVAAAYYSGWVVSSWNANSVRIVVVALDFLSLLAAVNLVVAIIRLKDMKQEEGAQEQTQDPEAAKKKRKLVRELERWFCCVFLLVFFATGWLIGIEYQSSSKDRVALAVAAVVALVLSFRCYSQYRYFSVRFADTVWRDFTAYALRSSDPQSSPILFE